MSLELEQIFEILDDIKSKKLYEQKNSGVAAKQKNKTISVPKIQISEDWGKAGTVDRGVLQTIADRASRGSAGRDPLRKLANLNNYLDFVIKNIDKQYSMSKLLSSIIIIETMMKMFNSFSAGSAGFLNEAFMSVFYGAGAEQVNPLNANGLEDIVVQNSKQHYSIKTLDNNKMTIKGSLTLLQNSLNDTYNNQIIYHVFIKEREDDKIKSLRMYELPFRRKDIPIFYSDSIDKSKTYAGLLYITDRPIAPKTDPEPDVKQTTVGTQPSLFEEAKKILPPTQLPLIQKEIGPDPNTVDYNELKLVSVSLVTAKDQPGKIHDRADFHIPASTWLKFVTGPKGGLFLDLSEQRFKQVLNRATEILDVQIAVLFDNLEQFSKNITNFFTQENTASGLKAYNNAKALEEKTATLIQTDGNEVKKSEGM